MQFTPLEIQRFSTEWFYHSLPENKFQYTAWEDRVTPSCTDLSTPQDRTDGTTVVAARFSISHPVSFVLISNNA